MTTACFPFFTANSITVRAMSSKCPTIMERPYDLFPTSSEIIEEHLKIDVIAMKIVKMNHIRVKFFNPLNELSCDCLTPKTCAVQSPSQYTVYLHIKVGTNPHSIPLEFLRNFFSSVGNLYFMSLSFQRSCKVSAYTSGASYAADTVNH